MSDLVLLGRRVLLPGGLAPAALHITNGKITDITSPDVIGHAAKVIDAGDRLVTPGVVDSHVHSRARVRQAAGRERATVIGRVAWIAVGRRIRGVLRLRLRRRITRSHRSRPGERSHPMEALDPLLSTGTAAFYMLVPPPLPAGIFDRIQSTNISTRTLYPVWAQTPAP
jgi:hypothetical protein